MKETIKTGSPVRSLIAMKEWGWKVGDIGILEDIMIHEDISVIAFKLNINNSRHWITRTDFEIISGEEDV